MSTPKSTVRTIGNELAALPQVKELLKKYGLASVEYAGGTIYEEAFTVKIRFNHEAEEGLTLVESPARFGKSKFAQHGLPEDIIGKPVRLNGRPFTIVDVKPQNAQGSLKKCVVIEGSGGGRYVTTAADILRVLNIKPANGLPPNTLVRRPIPGTPNAELSPEIKAQFESLASQLSPENLSCDGELSKAQINGRRGAIMSKWKALEREAGRSVAFDEFPY